MSGVAQPTAFAPALSHAVFGELITTKSTGHVLVVLVLGVLVTLPGQPKGHCSTIAASWDSHEASLNPPHKQLTFELAQWTPMNNRKGALDHNEEHPRVSRADPGRPAVRSIDKNLKLV